MYCTYCGSRRHNIEMCSKTWPGSSARLHLRCTYCGSRKHNYEACRKRHGGSLPGAQRIKD